MEWQNVVRLRLEEYVSIDYRKRRIKVYFESWYLEKRGSGPCAWDRRREGKGLRHRGRRGHGGTRRAHHGDGSCNAAGDIVWIFSSLYETRRRSGLCKTEKEEMAMKNKEGRSVKELWRYLTLQW